LYNSAEGELTDEKKNEADKEFLSKSFQNRVKNITSLKRPNGEYQIPLLDPFFRNIIYIHLAKRNHELNPTSTVTLGNIFPETKKDFYFMKAMANNTQFAEKINSLLNRLNKLDEERKNLDTQTLTIYKILPSSNS
jgi:ribosomal protein L22